MNKIKEQNKTSKTRKRILIVDDHPVVRQGLAQFINLEPDLEVCAEAGNVKEALEAVEKQKFDLAIIDMLLENTTGIQIIEKIRLRIPDLPIPIFSISNDLYYIKRAFETGARGYITKEEIVEEVINAIRQVLDGKIFLSASLAKKFPRRTIDRVKAGDLDDSVWE